MALVKCQILKHPFNEIIYTYIIHLVDIGIYMMWQYEIFITMYGEEHGGGVRILLRHANANLSVESLWIVSSLFYFVTLCAVSDCMAAESCMTLYDSVYMTCAFYKIQCNCRPVPIMDSNRIMGAC